MCAQGEFETGFERGGQTREHAQLAKTLGVAKLVIAVNKMDDPSITGPNGEWSKERYDEIQTRMLPFLRQCGYNPKKDIVFLPMSGLHGTNLKDAPPKNICSWCAANSCCPPRGGGSPLPGPPFYSGPYDPCCKGPTWSLDILRLRGTNLKKAALKKVCSW